jgi:hypothetical protein
VPGQQRAGGDDPLETQPTGEQAGQRGQDRSVRPCGARSADLTTEHRDFVAEDQDLDVLGRGAPGEQRERANILMAIEYSSRNSTVGDHA